MKNDLNSFAEAYEDTFAYAFDNKIILNWYPKRLLSKLSADSRVLELGIGHGITCNEFSHYFKNYTVIDGSDSVIDQFRRQYPDSKAEIVNGYFEDFESDAKFDVIVMGFVLEHVDDPAEILKRFRQFLAPGGRCFVAVPNAESLHRQFGFEAGLLDDLMTLGQGDLELGHQRLYTTESLNQELTTCGYQVINVEGIFLKPFTTNQIKSLALDDVILEAMCKVGMRYPELSVGLLVEAELTP